MTYACELRTPQKSQFKPTHRARGTEGRQEALPNVVGNQIFEQWFNDANEVVEWVGFRVGARFAVAVKERAHWWLDESHTIELNTYRHAYEYGWHSHQSRGKGGLEQHARGTKAARNIF
jgi:hypothetical protein